MAPPKTKDLQAECRAAGLDDRGTVSQLAARLKLDREKRQECPPEDEDEDEEDENPEPECDAILVTRSTTGGEEEMKLAAKKAFERALEEEVLDVTNVRGELYVTNPRGLGFAGLPERFHILEEKDALKDTKIVSQGTKIASQDTKIASQDTKIASQDAKIASQDTVIALLKRDLAEVKEYVSVLRVASEDYRRIRSRFVSTFVRDKLGNETQLDKDIIKAGNATAHGGDAVVDALLYDGIGGRRDTYAFEELYGLHPYDVKRITHQETIEVLNLHATIKANKERTGTDEFYERFAQFIQTLKRLEPGVDYLVGPENATCIAYKRLHDCKIYKPSPLPAPPVENA